MILFVLSCLVLFLFLFLFCCLIHFENYFCIIDIYQKKSWLLTLTLFHPIHTLFTFHIHRRIDAMVEHNYKYTFYKTTSSFSLYCFLLTGGGFFFFLATHQNHHNQSLFWAFITQQLNYSY